MTTLFLVLHVLSAIVGLGPAFALPFIGAIAQREPATAARLAGAVHRVTSVLVVPLGLSLAATGVVLLLLLHIDLTRNAWLGASIVIYAVAMGWVLLVQLPSAGRLAALAGPGPSPELGSLLRRLNAGWMGVTTAVAVIATLMVWRPGGNV